MPPKRYLNSTEVGERLGLSRRAVNQRQERGSANLPVPDVVISLRQIGDVFGWDPGREDLVPQSALDPRSVAWLPADPSSLPGDTLIGPAQWAHLAGVTEWELLTLRDAGKIPAPDEFEDGKPRWYVSTYREWQGEQDKSSSEEE